MVGSARRKEEVGGAYQMVAICRQIKKKPSLYEKTLYLPNTNTDNKNKARSRHSFLLFKRKSCPLIAFSVYIYFMVTLFLLPQPNKKQSAWVNINLLLIREIKDSFSPKFYWFVPYYIFSNCTHNILRPRAGLFAISLLSTASQTFYMLLHVLKSLGYPKTHSPPLLSVESWINSFVPR